VEVAERHLEWHPDDARALHLGAGSLILLGQLERADRWLQRALRIDPNDPILLYNVACNYATLGRVEESLGYLERAQQYGTISAEWMRNDKDLAKLHGHPRYEALLGKASEQDEEP
jgi:Flp pilus assembly protein TadD